GVALLAGVAGRWLSHSDPGPQAALPSTTAAAPAANGAPPAGSTRPALVTVKIAASPADTEILLDGAKLEGNPFVGQFAKDASLRRLELRSVGRVTEARMIRLDQDLDLLIALPVDKTSPVRAGGVPVAVGAKAPAKRPADLAAPAMLAAPATPAAGTPGAALPPLTHRDTPAPARPIDDADPYAK
ncbi:MAG TPA: hypothetical protein VGJ91_11200, partial [Polyangiaceae bacterium]